MLGRYYDYPNGSDEVPAEPEDSWTPREMNFGDSPYWQGNVYYTSIGETTGRSPYGVYDLGGNIEEWTDSLVPPGQGAFRISRGGNFLSDASYLTYMGGIPRHPSWAEGSGIGLGLVLLMIPEPFTVALLLLGGPLMLMFRRSR